MFDLEAGNRLPEVPVPLVVQTVDSGDLSTAQSVSDVTRKFRESDSSYSDIKKFWKTYLDFRGVPAINALVIGSFLASLTGLEPLNQGKGNMQRLRNLALYYINQIGIQEPVHIEVTSSWDAVSGLMSENASKSNKKYQLTHMDWRNQVARKLILDGKEEQTHEMLDLGKEVTRGVLETGNYFQATETSTAFIPGVRDKFGPINARDIAQKAVSYVDGIVEENILFGMVFDFEAYQKGKHIPNLSVAPMQILQEGGWPVGSLFSRNEFIIFTPSNKPGNKE